MKKLNPNKEALDFLDKLDPKRYRQVMRKILSLLEHTTQSDVALLEGYEDILRADCGEYRIVYQVKKDTLYLIIIGKRNDDEVYKKLRRKCG